jgi:hypothetical protein
LAKPAYPRSKLNQSTRFDTPSEKGGRGQTAFHPSSDSRSSSYVPKTSRKRAGHTVDLSNNLVDDGSSPAIPGKHRSRGDPITTSIQIQSRRHDDLDLDAEIEIDGAFDLGEEVQHDWRLPAEQDGYSQVDVPPSSPSGGALPLVHHLKPIILPSSEIEDILPDLDDEIVVLDEEVSISGSLEQDGQSLTI